MSIMKFLFHNDTAFNKINLVSDTWTCLERGEGGKEIANHGWSRVKSFSQGTGAKGQQDHGVIKLSRSYTLKSQVQDAHDSPTQLPFFWAFFLYSFFEKKKYQVLFILFGAVMFGNPEWAQAEFLSPPSRFMKAPIQKSPDEKLHEVSDMYEKHFLREMMKAMRSTVHESGFIQQNQAEKIFREQLDDHYVDKWSEKGGIGLSKMIYEQLIDKFGVQMGIKKPVMKPQGPLPLDEKSNYTAHQFRHPGKTQALSYRIDRNSQNREGALANSNVNSEVNSVKSPWDGVLLGSKTLVDKQTMLEIEHDNGLKSQLVFKGDLSKISTGQKIQAGETLGVLNSEAKALYWTVEPDQSRGPQTVSE